MDQATHDMLRESITGWCARNEQRLAAMEHGPFDQALFAELNGLGVLHILHDPSMRDAMAMVAEAAHAFAAASPSVALLVVQQNMAAYLSGAADAPEPTGWVALPLYDAPGEWPHQVACTAQGAGVVLDGAWGSLPALPVAEQALLPVICGKEFALVQVNLHHATADTARGPSALSLGLRACPLTDLRFTRAAIDAESVLARGEDTRRKMEVLWSQAEVAMQAIRAAILTRSYTVAHEYAKVRRQGGKIIIEHTLIRKMLSNLFAAQSRFEDGWRDAAAALAPGEPLRAGRLGAFVQCAGELPRLTSDGIQLLGGNGYMEDYGQERLFRDAKQCEMLLGRPQAKTFAMWESASAQWKCQMPDGKWQMTDR